MTKDEMKTDLKRRILSVVDVGSVQMRVLLKMMNIRITQDDEDIPSAAILFDGGVSELVINSNFVESFCKTDEHLFMLVMHELYHVILGHTTFFSLNHEIDNLAFDAIINSMLCRNFPQERFVSFFKQMNSSASFPSCLLRPADVDTPEYCLDVLDNLYNSDTGTYYEVFQLLKSKLKKRILLISSSGEMSGIASAGAPGIVSNSKSDSASDATSAIASKMLSNCTLLGNHGGDADVSDGDVRKVIEDMISKWPRNIIVGGRDMGGAMRNEKLYETKARKLFRRKLLNLLYRSGENSDTCKTVYLRNITEDSYEAKTFLPQASDRLAVARRMVWGRLCMYDSNCRTVMATHEKNISTYVYLDVSGSVSCVLAEFVSILLEPFAKRLCRIYAFSTEVYEPKISELRNGRYRTTGGTDGNCVFEHYFSLPRSDRPKNIFMVTDGEIGRVSYSDRLKREKVRVNVALIGSSQDRYVHSFANRIEYFNDNISRISNGVSKMTEGLKWLSS